MSVEIEDQDLLKEFEDSIQNMKLSLKHELFMSASKLVLITVVCCFVVYIGIFFVKFDGILTTQEMGLSFALFILCSVFLQSRKKQYFETMKSKNEFHGEVLMNSTRTIQNLQEARLR